MSRRLKQVIYGSFYLLILGGVFLIVYFSFLKPSPSCFDGKLNQNEEGIDCGGVCAQICFPEDFSDLEVERTRIFRISPSRISLLAEVKNLNPTLAAKNFSYTFTLFNEKDKSLGTFSGESQIYSAETIYLLVPNINVTSSLAERVELKIGQPEWLKGSNLPKPKITVSDLKTVVTEGGIRVSGSLTNNDAAQFSRVEIMAILFGRFNQPIGASITELSNLGSNKTRTFEVLHPILSDLNPEVTRIQVLPALP